MSVTACKHLCTFMYITMLYFDQEGIVSTTKVKSVGVAEFRENLSEHLLADAPVAVTKHGLTVGYYIPTHQPVTAGDKRALGDAARQLSELLEQQGLDAEELIKAAQHLRSEGRG